MRRRRPGSGGGEVAFVGIGDGVVAPGVDEAFVEGVGKQVVVVVDHALVAREKCLDVVGHERAAEGEVVEPELPN